MCNLYTSRDIRLGAQEPCASFEPLPDCARQGRVQAIRAHAEQDKQTAQKQDLAHHRPPRWINKLGEKRQEKQCRLRVQDTHNKPLRENAIALQRDNAEGLVMALACPQGAETQRDQIGGSYILHGRKRDR